jgi:hypothetical protein
MLGGIEGDVRSPGHPVLRPTVVHQSRGPPWRATGATGGAAPQDLLPIALAPAATRRRAGPTSRRRRPTTRPARPVRRADPARPRSLWRPAPRKPDRPGPRKQRPRRSRLPSQSLAVPRASARQASMRGLRAARRGSTPGRSTPARRVGARRRRRPRARAARRPRHPAHRPGRRARLQAALPRAAPGGHPRHPEAVRASAARHRLARRPGRARPEHPPAAWAAGSAPAWSAA